MKSASGDGFIFNIDGFFSMVASEAAKLPAAQGLEDALRRSSTFLQGLRMRLIGISRLRMFFWHFSAESRSTQNHLRDGAAQTKAYFWAKLRAADSYLEVSFLAHMSNFRGHQGSGESHLSTGWVYQIRKDIVALSGGHTLGRAHPESELLKEETEGLLNASIVEMSAKDEDLFFKDYAESHKKLSELGFTPRHTDSATKTIANSAAVLLLPLLLSS
ncbi:hypothetical protein OPV22_008022 [Ensete ventricosum]|uniref:Plant heme peroxidase family profile domain-containing protein n=1 Tax=Ensete ventricosum TaxID=4639 RepID=A0AAV8PNC5_ENSVE|nr:hypothetical protein OPV22_008022 [Ensete ventricosum]